MNAPRITDAELHAHADGLLAPERSAAVESYLAAHPREAERIRAFRAQNRALHALFDPVLDEPLPGPLQQLAARAPRAASGDGAHRRWPLRAAAALALLLGGAVAGWIGHERLADDAAATAAADTLARRAAIAHTVFSPDMRRPVEVDAAHEEQLVAWLSKRLGAPVHPPRLGSLGFELIGGRLLPGGSGPVAQFMYQDASGQRLTLYVTTEGAPAAGTGFRFAEEGALRVFYWLDGGYGYALSGALDKADLGRIASAVYDQLERDRRR